MAHRLRRRPGGDVVGRAKGYRGAADSSMDSLDSLISSCALSVHLCGPNRPNRNETRATSSETYPAPDPLPARQTDPQLARMDVAHVTRVEGPDDSASGEQLALESSRPIH